MLRATGTRLHAAWAGALCAALYAQCGYGEEEHVQIHGKIVDADTGEIIAARLYIKDSAGEWYFAESAAPEGSAVVYDRQNWVNENAIERHTTLSAHPFKAEVPSGQYTLCAECGKEYVPTSVTVEAAEEAEAVIPLRRWINMADRGWYSGDTHVHRTPEELRNVALAEDVNVTFPLSYWVRDAYISALKDESAPAEPPASTPVGIDEEHVMYLMNTEYEIFRIGEESYVFGAFFVLSHNTPIEEPVPPVAHVRAKADAENALLELDKHDWPWAMMLVPIVDVDLYELSNNHVWRTEFGITNWSTPAPQYMGLPNNGEGGGELDWIHYGLENYYMLLNCGFRLRPTAGTASGVHPVPLGFGRVYVHVDGKFSYEKWLDGLDAGRSFVTTGPMLLAALDGKLPGHEFTFEDKKTFTVSGEVTGDRPISAIEILVNGQVAHELKPEPTTDGPAQCYRFEQTITADSSAWVAVRCWQPHDNGKVRFAHTGPWHLAVPGKPVKPRPEQINYLIKRVEDQVERAESVLKPEAVDEYRRALAIYKEIAGR